MQLELEASPRACHRRASRNHAPALGADSSPRPLPLRLRRYTAIHRTPQQTHGQATTCSFHAGRPPLARRRRRSRWATHFSRVHTRCTCNFTSRLPLRAAAAMARSGRAAVDRMAPLHSVRILLDCTFFRPPADHHWSLTAANNCTYIHMQLDCGQRERAIAHNAQLQLHTSCSAPNDSVLHTLPLHVTTLLLLLCGHPVYIVVHDMTCLYIVSCLHPHVHLLLAAFDF